ncbi:MAG: helix-turn-helix domain-containing protein [Candidatus Hodarchaeales archaeon]|jgi:predicted DNA binding protein
MVYEIRVRFKHSCPFLRFSKFFKTKPVYSYCSRTHDVIQLPERLSEDKKQKAQNLFPNFANWRINSPSHSSQPSIISMDCVCGVVYYHTLSSIIRENGGVPLYPVTYVNGWEYRKIICFNDSDAERVINAIKEKLSEENKYRDEKDFKRGIRDSAIFEELEVNNIGEDGLFRAQTFFMSDIIENITNVQLNVLLTAYQEGYYEIPRRIKLEEIGKKMDRSRQAVEKSLRKAENKLINSVVPFLLLDKED